MSGSFALASLVIIASSSGSASGLVSRPAATAACTRTSGDGSPVAAEIHFRGDGVSYAYQSGLDPEALDCEPGRLITIALLQKFIESGLVAVEQPRDDLRRRTFGVHLFAIGDRQRRAFGFFILVNEIRSRGA